MLSAPEHTTAPTAVFESTPRLRLEPTASRHTLLDGGWWPRSTDPVAELPGLVHALDGRHGPVIRLMLGAAEWDTRPRRLAVAGRTVRLGWFTTQPAGLITAFVGDGARIDLLVVPPHTPMATARAAMAVAADAANTVHAPDILAITTDRVADGDATQEAAWETEGGQPLRDDVQPGR